MYINNRKLTSRDWTSRKALEIFIYVLIKSWRHKNAVDKYDLLFDLWTPASDRIKACGDVRNNMMTRLRKIFNECDEEMLPKRPDDILFNWESGNYYLDIEHFVKDIKDAKTLLKKDQKEAAELKFKSALSLVRGDLAEGFEGLYLESDRAYFLSLKCEAEEILTSMQP